MFINLQCACFSLVIKLKFSKNQKREIHCVNQKALKTENKTIKILKEKKQRASQAFPPPHKFYKEESYTCLSSLYVIPHPPGVVPNTKFLFVWKLYYWGKTVKVKMEGSYITNGDFFPTSSLT